MTADTPIEVAIGLAILAFIAAHWLIHGRRP